MAKFIVQVDLAIDADSIEYLEDKSAELEEVIGNLFEDADLVSCKVDVFEADEEEDDDYSDDEEFGAFEDEEEDYYEDDD